jgi:hypothetical protein
LLSLEQAAVIVLGSSGVHYWNQSAQGDERWQAEGVLVPISNDPPSDQPELSLSVRLQEISQQAESLTPAVGREINELLLETSSSDALSVDFTHLSRSCHGWVYLSIRAAGEFSYFEGFAEAKGDRETTLQGVLTWPCRG